MEEALCWDVLSAVVTNYRRATFDKIVLFFSLFSLFSRVF